MTESIYNKANWIQWVTAVLVILALLLSFGSYTKDVDVDNSKLERQIAALDEKIDDGLVIGVDVSEGNLTQEIHEKMFEDDAWESEAEILAMEELEEDDYKKLYRYIRDVSENGIDEEEDIEEVIIKDVTISNSDVEDKDADVEIELKVYYEDSDGDRKKIYTDVTIKIRDGEAKNLRSSDFE